MRSTAIWGFWWCPTLVTHYRAWGLRRPRRLLLCRRAHASDSESGERANLNGLIAPWCGPFGEGAVLLVQFEQSRSPEYRSHGGQKVMHLKGLPEDQSAHTPNE